MSRLETVYFIYGIIAAVASVASIIATTVSICSAIVSARTASQRRHPPPAPECGEAK